MGDFDSVDPLILHSFRNIEGGKKPVILQFQPEKDETDTELAIRTAIQKGSNVIHLLGATGSRMDHMIGNLHLQRGWTVAWWTAITGFASYVRAWF